MIGVCFVIACEFIWCDIGVTIADSVMCIVVCWWMMRIQKANFLVTRQGFSYIIWTVAVFTHNYPQPHNQHHHCKRHQRWCTHPSHQGVDRLCGRQRSTSMRSRAAPRSCTRHAMSCVLLLLATVRIFAKRA